MKKPLLIILLALAVNSCGQIIKGDIRNVEILLEKARKNLLTAESFSDIKRKNMLLTTAKDQLDTAKQISRKEIALISKVNIELTYYYFVSGDYAEAKKYSTEASKNNDAPFNKILHARILLKEQGKEYANDAVVILKKVLNDLPDNSMANLTLGDSYFLLGSFGDSLKHYERVLTLDNGFQVQAADRLEVLDEIRRTDININKVKDLIFSSSIRRDEAAYILDRIFDISGQLKFGMPLENKVSDISKSMYAESIQNLRNKGFFTYVKGGNFNPFAIVSRGEIAKIIEDYVVLKTGNKLSREQFKNDKESLIKGIKVGDEYYNPLRLAVQMKIMDLSLNGSINPLEPISGLETLITMKKLIEKSGKISAK